MVRERRGPSSSGRVRLGISIIAPQTMESVCITLAFWTLDVPMLTGGHCEGGGGMTLLVRGGGETERAAPAPAPAPAPAA
jgi:hypothetical protein